jgi:hypothetical protein
MKKKELKEKVAALEKTLLAIDELNHINQESINGGNPVINLDHTAYLLNHLIEPAMYQVEALRMMIDELKAAA